MPRLPIVSGAKAVKVFEKNGWHHVRNKGDHMILTKPKIPFNLSIPKHRELDRGLLRGLMGDAGKTVDKFNKLL